MEQNWQKCSHSALFMCNKICQLNGRLKTIGINATQYKGKFLAESSDENFQTFASQDERPGCRLGWCLSSWQRSPLATCTVERTYSCSEL